MSHPKNKHLPPCSKCANHAQIKDSTEGFICADCWLIKNKERVEK